MSAFRIRWVGIWVLPLLVCCGGGSSAVQSGDAVVEETQQAGADLKLTPDLAADVQSSEIPTKPGSYELVLLHDGFSRSYRLLISSEPAPGTVVPLLIGLHGGGGSVAGFAREAAAFLKLAQDAGWIVALPQGLPGTSSEETGWWSAIHCCDIAFDSGIDDVGFVVNLIERLEAALPIDPKHVVLVGLGNGGMLAQRLAAEKSVLFSNVVSVNGTPGGKPNPGAKQLMVTPQGSVNQVFVHGNQGGEILVGDAPTGSNGPQHIDWRSAQLFWGKDAYNCLNTFERARYVTDAGAADYWVWSSCQTAILLFLTIDGLGYQWPTTSASGGWPAEAEI